MGKIVCREIRANNVNLVVIERNPDYLKEKENILLIIGDATQDEILKEVGIEKTVGLISVLPTDVGNL